MSNEEKVVSRAFCALKLNTLLLMPFYSSLITRSSSLFSYLIETALPTPNESRFIFRFHFSLDFIILSQLTSRPSYAAIRPKIVVSVVSAPMFTLVVEFA